MSDPAAPPPNGPLRRLGGQDPQWAGIYRAAALALLAVLTWIGQQSLSRLDRIEDQVVGLGNRVTAEETRTREVDRRLNRIEGR